uniref:SWIM-type domain-containing protein n=1 Tax=Meloidogyne incognita TaxID=6306 RepID=A0A914MG39_MELIC
MEEEPERGLVAGKCYCKTMLMDQNKVTGKCTCKALVMGEQCDHCLQEHYGLSVDDPNGCQTW